MIYFKIFLILAIIFVPYVPKAHIKDWRSLLAWAAFKMGASITIWELL